MSKLLWSLKSRIYPFMRRVPGIAGILRRENAGVRALLNQVPLKAMERVLDLGTGRGNTLTLLAKRSAFRFAADYSLQMLKRTKPRFPASYLVNAGATALPFKAGAFDLIACVGLSELIPEFQALVGAIAEVLALGGCCVMTIALPKRINRMRALLGYRMYPVTSEKAERTFRECGFVIIDRKYCTLQVQYLVQKVQY